MSDDILVYGSTWEEHDKRLHCVLQTLQDSGLTLKWPKCRFTQTSLTYLGFVFSAEAYTLVVTYRDMHPQSSTALEKYTSAWTCEARIKQLNRNAKLPPIRL